MSDVIAALAKGKVKIKFKKVDGSIREGVFTTNKDLVAAGGYAPKPLLEGQTPKVRAVNPNVVSVFEVSTNLWKSFKRDALIEWSEVK